MGGAGLYGDGRERRVGYSDLQYVPARTVHDEAETVVLRAGDRDRSV